MKRIEERGRERRKEVKISEERRGKEGRSLYFIFSEYY